MNTFKKTLIAAASASIMFAACSDDSSSNASSDESSTTVATSSSSTKGDAKSSSSAKDDDKSSSSTVASTKYGISFMVGESQFYGTTALDEDFNTAIKSFHETTSSGSLVYFNGALYSLSMDETGASVLKMFKLDKNQDVPEKPTKTRSFNSTALMMQFVDNNKMYVIETMADKLIALNPSDLSITAEIDLSEYVDEEVSAVMAFPGSSAISDGKLYVTLYQVVDLNNSIMGPQGEVAIIDVATDKVIKVASESETSALGVYDDMNNTMAFTDEEGDVYFYANGAMNFIEGYNEGFVRIKKGEEDFDTSYVFHLHEAKYDGKSSNTNWLMTGGVYAGNGKFVGLFGDLSDPTNFNNFEWQYVVIDIYKKSIKKIDLGLTLPWLVPSVHMDTDGKVLLGHMDEEGASVLYRYDLDSDKITKVADVETGFVYYVFPLSNN